MEGDSLVHGSLSLLRHRHNNNNKPEVNISKIRVTKWQGKDVTGTELIMLVLY